LQFTIRGFSPLLILAACSSGPTPEQLLEIEGLREDLAEVEANLATIRDEASLVDFPLLEVFSYSRVTTVGLTRDLLEQRIFALETGAPMTLIVASAVIDSTLVSQLENEIDELREEIAQTQDQLRSGDAVPLIAIFTEATLAAQKFTLALVEYGYLGAKYGLISPDIPQDLNLLEELRNIEIVPPSGGN